MINKNLILLISNNIEDQLDKLVFNYVFNLPIDNYICYYDKASKQNRIDILKILHKIGNTNYTSNAIDFASLNGHNEVLKWWWFKSELELKYTHFAMDYASANGFVDTLELWKSSKLQLKYTSFPIYNATCKADTVMLDWWLRSELKIKISPVKITNNCLSSKNSHKAFEYWLINDKFKYNYGDDL